MTLVNGKGARALRRGDVQRAGQWFKRQAKTTLARSGYVVSRLDDKSRRYVAVTHNAEVPLPPGAESTLRADNPELLALQRSYARMESAATASTQWTSRFLKKNLSLAWFRGDNAYVWQFRVLRGSADAQMYLSLLDVQSRDRLGLLDRLTEDGLFGAWTFTFGDRRPVSRDLLDSVNEINYLDARIGLSTMPALRVLDIGAGYGRLAHRMSAALPDLERYDCIDGVAVSTFLCNYYTGFRDLPPSVRVLPVHDHEKLEESYDLAVNIHSFAECSRETIQWWLDRISERRIDWLLIVPNTPEELLSTEADGTKLEFRSLVQAAGYELVDCRRTHESPEMLDLIDVRDKFYLFRRTGS